MKRPNPLLLFALVLYLSGLPFALRSDGADGAKLWTGDAPWKTDFRRHSVPLEEIISGGPPRDGIPSIDRPLFVSPEAAASWLSGAEPVIRLEVGREAKAYPLQILMWHEIVNDAIARTPVAVTFCPLCNSAYVFDRRLEGMILEFGTTGRLRHSDLIMYDRQTESWWQQMTGDAIVGKLTGKRLATLPASMISFADFRAAHPDGKVLSRKTGFRRSYGQNPYVGYDRIDQPPFLFQGKIDNRLPPMERVVTVSVGTTHKAYPYSVLSRKKVVADEVNGKRIVVFYLEGMVSALDGPAIAESRKVGASSVFEDSIGGRRLSFVEEGGFFKDRETKSTWNILGQALAGPLKGRALTPVIHGDTFAFAWFAFRPGTLLYNP
ncbi:MAG: DUF3179 domain-containing protein [Candidatus Tectomicrobia bacterium]|uniref:DUF3179 domain-containing protein n=1 Tax=Tectimicrobiota bacterium TaxID=2528274 RepID=A0A932GQ74_UNCTE|nr:DUF3179 domain-containing protein [Candidatus Tectomicrobia bacterium]